MEFIFVLAVLGSNSIKWSFTQSNSSQQLEAVIAEDLKELHFQWNKDLNPRLLMWKSKTRVTSYDELITMSYDDKSMSYELKSTSFELKYTSYEFKSESYVLKSSYEFKSMSFEFKSTSYELKTTSYKTKRTSW